MILVIVQPEFSWNYFNKYDLILIPYFENLVQMPVISRLPFSRNEVAQNILNPIEIACYSRTSNDEIIVDSDQNLRYYYFPDELLDNQLSLSAGRGNFKDSRSEMKDVCSMDGLLKSIQDIEMKKGSRLKVNIITFRGIFRKLISAAFENSRFQEPLDLRVVLFDDQIFIKEIAKKDTYEQGTIDLNTFSGYKFETLATTNRPVNSCTREEIESRHLETVGNGDEFVTVVGTGIGSHRLILGAEVDAIFDYKDTESQRKNISHYCELKCSKGIYNERDAQNFANKLFRTWLQCFLIGIPRIIYGFRDENFKLATIEEYSLENIVPMLQRYNPQIAENCAEAIGWYYKIVDWLLTIQNRYSQKISRDTVVPFKLTCKDQELQMIDILSGDNEYEEIVNNEMVLSNQFKEWRRSLHQDKD